MGDPLKKVVDFLRSQDAFSGKLKVAGKDYYFTPGEGALALPASVTAAIAYWSGLQIAFNYIVNVGDALSVWTPGGPIHWVDPSGLEGPQTQRSYFDYLNFNHPGKVPRPVFDKKGKGIPDIMTTRKNLQQFYEIKPDNAGGLRDGKEKLGRIVSTLGRFFPASFYKAGGQKDILPLSLQCHDLSCGAADCKLFLEQRMDPQVDGLILYKFRVQFAIDPGPFITKAVIALAIVAAIEGGAAALSRAAGQAVGGGMIDAAEETGIRKIRVELVKRVAEHVASEGAAEQIGELGSEGVVETVYKHAIKKAIPNPH